MRHDKRPGFSRLPKAGAAALCIAAAMVMGACSTGPAVMYGDSTGLAAEQRLIIEQQRRELEDMGTAITAVHDGLGRAIDAVTASLNGTGSLQEQFAAIDRFVRSVIASQRALEDVQRADGPADAAAR